MSSAASGNPSVPPALRCDAGSARRERKFTRQGRRHVAADVLPCHPVGCAKIREHSVDGVAMQNSTLRRPKRERVIETVWILVLELNRPGGAAVECLVNTESVGLFPIDIKYATLALKASTSRNCKASAPGTTPAFQVSPPSVVTVNVPLRPDAQTTRGFTGDTAIRPLVVPLSCGVSVG